jgi:type IV pilus assembly protein PilC
MPTFIYQAFNENGSKVNGTLEAETSDAANALLLAREFIPVKVSQKHQLSGTSLRQDLLERFNRVKAPELILFTKQFKTLLNAGVPMLSILKALENQTESKALKGIILSLAQDVKEGASLYDSFRKFPRVFSPLYCSMVRAGEISGALPQILERLIYLIEHEHNLKSNIRSALQYPAVVLSFLAIAFIVLLTFVVPKFVTQFSRAGLELPLPTVICMKMYLIVSNYWYILLILVVLMGVGWNAYVKTPDGRYMKDRVLMRLPLVGPLLIKAAMSRFASIFSILQSSGVAVLDSMRILSDTINNAAISKEFQNITERLEEGRGISVPLRSAKYFTPIVINMVAVGEDSGNLEDMLREVSLHYDSEMEYAMKKLSDAIGPILTIGLAVVIGFFALAIYLPMWDLTKMVH